MSRHSAARLTTTVPNMILLVICLQVAALATMTTTSVKALSSTSTPTSNPAAIDCAVIGVGVLGTSLCRQILEDPDFKGFTGVTRTTKNHDAIRAAVLLGESTDDDDDRFRLIAASGGSGDVAAPPRRKSTFTNVVFCAPPSGFEDYPAAVKEAAERYWEGPNGGGVFVFTSSGAV